MASNHLVERFREAYKDRPDFLALFSETAVSIYDLLPPEIKTLAAALLAGESGVQSAMAIAECEGIDLDLFDASLRSLQRKRLLFVKDGQFDFSPAQERLRMQIAEEARATQYEAPEVRLVVRPLAEVVAAMASSEKSPAAGLGKVYSFVFGREVSGRQWGVLGKIANLIGTRRAALLLLENATNAFEGDPMNALLAMASARSKEWRPEGAPDPEEQRRERNEAADTGWRMRMRRWMWEYGGENHALAAIDQAEDMSREGRCNPPLSPEQAEADRRQVRLDFARWKALGCPPIE